MWRTRMPRRKLRLRRYESVLRYPDSHAVPDINADTHVDCNGALGVNSHAAGRAQHDADSNDSDAARRADVLRGVSESLWRGGPMLRGWRHHRLPVSRVPHT